MSVAVTMIQEQTTRLSLLTVIMSGEAPAQEIQINIKGPSELKLQITITIDKSVLDLKKAIAEKSEVEAERQRLIYSGRVLKDDDILSVYKIQPGHTIHMVKGVARSGGSSSTPQQLPTMQTGQNPSDPLTQLNGHRAFGAMAGVNPFSEMGLNPNDPNMMQSMLNNPQFLQQMSRMMSDPATLDQLIAMDPQMQAYAPQMRQMFQNPQFREMISDPQRLQQMLQMSSILRGGGGIGASGGFPAPGIPNTTPLSNNPSAPFNLFAPPTVGAGAGAGGGMFNMDPAAMQQMLGVMGGMGDLDGWGAPALPAVPADARPPEERFQVQLQQLQDMGFLNASQNVRALLATAENVHSAIEYILGGGGLM